MSATDKLIERLKFEASGWTGEPSGICAQAADTITSLKEENERLKTALEPFAAMSRRFDAAARGFSVEPRPDSYVPRTDFTHGELRAAARALSNTGDAG